MDNRDHIDIVSIFLEVFYSSHYYSTHVLVSGPTEGTIQPTPVLEKI
jgi:hypothetical protein